MLKLIVPYLHLRARLQHRAGTRGTPVSTAAAGMLKLANLAGDARMLFRLWGAYSYHHHVIEILEATDIRSLHSRSRQPRSSPDVSLRCLLRAIPFSLKTCVRFRRCAGADLSYLQVYFPLSNGSPQWNGTLRLHAVS